MNQAKASVPSATADLKQRPTIDSTRFVDFSRSILHRGLLLLLLGCRRLLLLPLLPLVLVLVLLVLFLFLLLLL